MKITAATHNEFIEKCKSELAMNFECPSEQILGVYGSKMGLTSKEMFEVICQHNESQTKEPVKDYLA
jgi:hypothetical protein